MIMTPTDTEKFLTVQDLVKNYQVGGSKVEVLNGVNLDVERGQTLAVVGASGVGKSTLLHIIGALDRPTSGRVVLDGIEFSRQDDKKLALIRNNKIGFVFQFHHLLPEFTALENAAMPCLIGRLDKKTAFETAEAILVRVGLAERLKHRIGELSGGEQQRVALARALVRRPELLLADEPTGNLDAKTGMKINELILELNEENGLTSIVVTHNLELAGMMSRRITLFEGKAVEER